MIIKYNNHLIYRYKFTFGEECILFSERFNIDLISYKEEEVYIHYFANRIITMKYCIEPLSQYEYFSVYCLGNTNNLFLDYKYSNFKDKIRELYVD